MPFNVLFFPPAGEGAKKHLFNMAVKHALGLWRQPEALSRG